MLSLFQAEAEYSVEETLKTLQNQEGFQGFIIINKEGIVIRSSLDIESARQYACHVHRLVMKTRSTMQVIEPQSDLTILKVLSKKNEILIAPDKDYLVIIIQDPSD
ncbi:dynein light chain roadblock-type 1-like [Austrofundulus limnaeus]|uniref:Dynein light chain roadblock n=1 Tax=Austrofundulus limnaeus TaxID=52670 RepID=A0A2I4BVW2_AUSLI|nr:PREDICTED: dynein light chain roadblock-type 1-like [Austrofundulus limnaeus]